MLQDKPHFQTLDLIDHIMKKGPLTYTVSVTSRKLALSY